jgi:hypothetical protein
MSAESTTSTPLELGRRLATVAECRSRADQLHESLAQAYRALAAADAIAEVTPALDELRSLDEEDVTQASELLNESFAMMFGVFGLGGVLKAVSAADRLAEALHEREEELERQIAAGDLP